MFGKTKTLGQRLKSLFSFGAGSDEFFEELEDLLIEADLGAQFTVQLVQSLRDAGRFANREQLVAAMREQLLSHVREAPLRLDPQRLNIVLLLGVNGVGKTTNLAKLAAYYQREWPTQGVVLAAGDTFRAAAVDQLAAHAQRLQVRIVKQSTGSDAGAVIYDAVQSAAARSERLVLADTAGRMHNRANLIAELEKIHAIIQRLAADAVYRKVLVIDATTGQNALRQVELFHQAVGVDSILLAKYDSTARGGILVPIARDFGVGCGFLGVGERYEDLRPFDPATYVGELLAAG